MKYYEVIRDGTPSLIRTDTELIRMDYVLIRMDVETDPDDYVLIWMGLRLI